MIVQEAMTPDPVTATPTTSIERVLRMLVEGDIRHLPIVEGDVLIGMVSDRDLRSVVPSVLEEYERPQQAQRLLAQPIRNVMSTDVIAVHPESELLEVVDLMLEHKIGAVPVVDAESRTLVGIISYVDVLRVTRDSL